MYLERTLEKFIAEASAQFPAILLCGPRQVGKTTILRHIAERTKRQYVTLDDTAIAALAREEPALFLQRFKSPVLIDEIQYAPQLLPYIKMQIDMQQETGMFWLTGSQQFHLMQGISESLAGRIGIMYLLGLSLRELSRSPRLVAPFVPNQELLFERIKNHVPLSLATVYDIIWRGSFPAMWVPRGGHDSTKKKGKHQTGEAALLESSNVDRDLFYSSYVQTYLQRDVRQLANVGDEGAFFKYLRAAAARTGQLLNLSDMARDVAISVPTAKRWLSVLEASGIVYLLEPYYSNTTKRLVKAPKLYFLDTGLCCYLTEWSSPETLEAGAMSGAILETFIFTEVLKSYWFNGKRAPLYYYRDKDKKEIDLLIVRDGTIYPLEFKKTASPSKDAIKNFGVLEHLDKRIGDGGVICFAETLLPITKGISAIPIGLL